MPSVTNVELLDTTLISAEAAHPHRKEPFHLPSKVEAKLKKHRDLGIIEDTVGSTP